MKTKTHRQKLKEKYESNQLFIQKAVNLSEADYFNFIFEIGCKFLEELFPSNSNFGIYYQKFAYSKSFWNWWKVEWKQWEGGYRHYLNNGGVEPTLTSYKSDFEQMVMDSDVENSFNQIYLKTIYNGEI